MATETLKDANFNIIGYLEDNGDTITLKDANFNIKGYYNKGDNQTKDANFNIVGTGNLLTMLLNQ